MSVRTKPVERVRGASDLRPNEWAAVTAARAALSETFSLFGYRGVDVPVLEHTELYLRKAGAAIGSRIYSFTDRGGRSVCLRPEFTASIARLYAANRSEFALPARLQYSGPAFRYEKPQRGTYRQYTESGVELIGAHGPAADAEILQIAVESLENLGVRGFDTVIGHLGILSDFLGGLGLSDRVESLLRESMETLQRPNAGIREVRSRLEAETMEDTSPGIGAASKQLGEMMARVPELEHDDIKTIIAAVLEGLEINLDGRRERSDIVDRLMTRLTRTEERERINRALDFIEKLATVADRPEPALKKTRRLVADFGLSPEPLDYVEAVFEQLSASGIETGDFTFNPAMGRGLQYYTGLVFEIFASDGTASFQVCGGGRYDDLIEIITGAPSTPAVGLTFGVERLLMAAGGDTDPIGADGSNVLVSPVDESRWHYAARVASILRAEGLSTELDVRRRGIGASLEFADRQNIPVLVVVGEREEASGQASLRMIETGDKRTVDLDALAREIRTLIGRGAS